MAIRANPQFLIATILFLMVCNASAEDVLASFVPEADANRLRNRHLETPLLHRRGLYWETFRARCSAEGLVSAISGRISAGMQFMGEISRSQRNDVHQVHGLAAGKRDLRRR